MEDTPSSLIQEFLVYDLPRELVFRGRDPFVPGHDRLLVLSKSPASPGGPESGSPSSSVTVASATGDGSPQSPSSKISIIALLQPALETLGGQVLTMSDVNQTPTPFSDATHAYQQPMLKFTDYRFPTTAVENSLVKPLTALCLDTVFRAFGLLGVISLTTGYYAVLVTARSVAAALGGRNLYSIDRMSLIACYPATTILTTAEVNYVTLLESLFNSMPNAFYCSYEWDLTRTVQQQCRAATVAPAHSSAPPASHGAPPPHPTVSCDGRFVFNAYLLRPFLTTPTPPYDWLTPMIQGAVEQREFSLGNRRFSLVVIARRSRYHVGPRFFKRGINGIGRVANEVECEQILWEASPMNVDTGDGVQNVLGLSSLVMMRGSIPLFWGHEDSTSIKPKVKIYSEIDTEYRRTRLHFDDLFERYGSPLVILNMVKQFPRTDVEAVLSSAFETAVAAVQNSYWRDQSQDDLSSASERLSSTCEEGRKLEKSDDKSDEEEDDIDDLRGILMRHASRLHPDNSMFPGECTTVPEKAIQYLTYDWISEEKAVGFDRCLRNLFRLAQLIIASVGLNVHTFIASKGTWEPAPLDVMPQLIQRGIPRVNCVDCLDRTNLGMLALGQEALRQGLILLGCLPLSACPSSLPMYLLQSVANLWGAVGDALSTSYAGSAALHRATIESKTAEVPSSNLCSTVFSACMMNTGKPSQETCPSRPFENETVTHIVQRFEESPLWRSVAMKYGYRPQPEDTAWTAKKRSNITIAVRRYIHNVFSDLDRQRGLNLLLGKYRPSPNQPSIWEVNVFPNKANILDEMARTSRMAVHQHFRRSFSVDAEGFARYSDNLETSSNGRLVSLTKTCCLSTRNIALEPDAEIAIPSINAQRHPVTLIQMAQRQPVDLSIEPS